MIRAEAAMAARTETAWPMMCTPRRPLRIRTGDGPWEVITPGVSWLAPDHELVKQHRHEFKTFTSKERRAAMFKARLERAAEPPAPRPVPPTAPVSATGPFGAKGRIAGPARTEASWRL